MGVVRVWLTPEVEYEVYHTDWDWGQRKDKPWLTAPLKEWRQYVQDYRPNRNRGPLRSRHVIKGGDIVLEGRTPADEFLWPPKVGEIAPDTFDLYPEDIIVSSRKQN
jgi:hypothetical protein